MAKLLGNIEHFTFEVSGLSEELKVAGFTGGEQISEPYCYTLKLACEDADLDFDTVVGKPGVLTLIGDHDNIERHVHGIVSCMRFLRQTQRFAVYEAKLVPQLSFLELRQNCRIFQNVTVPQIIESVLKNAQIASDQYKLQLNGKYEAREYCVQYRESDLDFISRLMEEEGIYYFFKHSKTSHLMMLVDNRSAHTKIAAPDQVLFHEISGAVEVEDSINSFTYSEHVQSGQVALRDFNFKKPALGLEVKKQQDKNAALEVYDYPGGYEVPAVGDKFTQVRLEALQADIKQGVGNSNCMRLVPGFQFTLAEYPRQKLNQEYFLTKLNCTAQQPQVLQEAASGKGTSYSNSFLCMPASVPYRAPQIHKRPKINGVQTAIVVGLAGEEIYVDEHGRVKVQFHWDREGKNDEKSSCWVRVSQLWAGASWGAMFIPRIGQEVIVGFLEGNLDRPLITGRVYHGTNRPPYPLPAEKTKSTIKSDSTKGGGGSNELRFEDLKDKEEIYLHGQKDWNIRIENDTKEWVGHDRHLIVMHDQMEKVEGDKHQKVVGVQNVKIDGTLSIESGADTQQKTAQHYAHEVGNEIHFKAGQKVVIEAGVELTIKAGGSFVKIDASGVTIMGAQIKLNSGGSAGSGSGSTPEVPKLPMEVAKTLPSQPAPAASPAATVLKDAAKSGTPFCEQCERKDMGSDIKQSSEPTTVSNKPATQKKMLSKQEEQSERTKQLMAGMTITAVSTQTRTEEEVVKEYLGTGEAGSKAPEVDETKQLDQAAELERKRKLMAGMEIKYTSTQTRTEEEVIKEYLGTGKTGSKAPGVDEIKKLDQAAELERKRKLMAGMAITGVSTQTRTEKEVVKEYLGTGKAGSKKPGLDEAKQRDKEKEIAKGAATKKDESTDL